MQRNSWALSYLLDSLGLDTKESVVFTTSQVIPMYTRVWEPLIQGLPSQIYTQECQTWWHPRKLESFPRWREWLGPGPPDFPDLSMRGGAGVMRAANTRSPAVQPAALLAVRVGVAGGLVLRGRWPLAARSRPWRRERSRASQACAARLLTSVLPVPQTNPAPGVVPLPPPQVCRK